jgi:hypothetical protein
VVPVACTVSFIRAVKVAAASVGVLRTGVNALPPLPAVTAAAIFFTEIGTCSDPVIAVICPKVRDTTSKAMLAPA